jgi:hypothetical protein
MATPTMKGILKLRQEMIDGMVDYLKSSEDDPDAAGAEYTQADIDNCAKIIGEFLAALDAVSGSKRDAAIMKIVKTTVLELNKLNDKCDGTLIETEQRDQIGVLIQQAALRAGLRTDEDDITEKWREW